MEQIGWIVAWSGYVAAWVCAIWFASACIIGGVLIARDEWRFRRSRPKPEDIRAYADELVTLHGREAYRINGDAMYEARLAKDSDRHRFLKEVSGELIQRFLSEAEAT